MSTVIDSGLLLKAVAQRKFKLVRLLVSGGCDVNYKGYDGKTALAVACSFLLGSKEDEDAVFMFAKFLLEHGADPNIQDLKGRTPLVYALRYLLSEDVIELLLKHEADPTLCDKKGVNALTFLNKRLWAQYRCCFTKFLKDDKDGSSQVIGKNNQQRNAGMKCVSSEINGNYTLYFSTQNEMPYVIEPNVDISKTFGNLDRRRSEEIEFQTLLAVLPKRKCMSSTSRPSIVLPALETISEDSQNHSQTREKNCISSSMTSLIEAVDNNSMTRTKKQYPRLNVHVIADNQNNPNNVSVTNVEKSRRWSSSILKAKQQGTLENTVHLSRSLCDISNADKNVLSNKFLNIPVKLPPIV